MAMFVFDNRRMAQITQTCQAYLPYQINFKFASFWN